MKNNITSVFFILSEQGFKVHALSQVCLLVELYDDFSVRHLEKSGLLRRDSLDDVSDVQFAVMVYILGDPERIYTGVEVREKKVAVSGYLVAEEDFVSFLIYKFNDVFLFFGSGYLQGYAAQLVVRRERECAECGVVCERDWL